MATTGTHRTATVFLALIVGAALGWLIASYAPKPVGPIATPTPSPVPDLTATAKPMGPSPTPTCVPLSTAGNHNIVVGPTSADVYPECLTIGSTDTVTWHPFSGNTLSIDFTEKVFANMTKVGTGWRVNPSGTSSYSGKVNKIGEPGSQVEYTYTQTLDGNTKDGRIIIKQGP